MSFVPPPARPTTLHKTGQAQGGLGAARRDHFPEGLWRFSALVATVPTLSLLARAIATRQN